MALAHARCYDTHSMPNANETSGVLLCVVTQDLTYRVSRTHSNCPSARTRLKKMLKRIQNLSTFNSYFCSYSVFLAFYCVELKSSVWDPAVCFPEER